MGDLCSPDSRGPQMAELVVTPFSSERGPWQPPHRSRAGPRRGSRGTGQTPSAPTRTAGGGTSWSSSAAGSAARSSASVMSGANGTITGVRLPGGVGGLTFTGNDRAPPRRQALPQPRSRARRDGDPTVDDPCTAATSTAPPRDEELRRLTATRQADRHDEGRRHRSRRYRRYGRCLAPAASRARRDARARTPFERDPWSTSQRSPLTTPASRRPGLGQRPSTDPERHARLRHRPRRALIERPVVPQRGSP